MRHETQVRLIKEFEKHLDAGTSVDAGGLMLNPTSVYVDPELAEREWNELFMSQPHVVGLSGDLPSSTYREALGMPALPLLSGQEVS